MDAAVRFRDAALRQNGFARISRYTASQTTKYLRSRSKCSCTASSTSYKQQSAQPDINVQTNVNRVNGNLEAEYDEKEIMRRKKISEANKGNVPWNKGRKHSPETIAKIKARTAEAMQRPEVLAKVQAKAANNVGRTHSSETKAKIAAATKTRHERAKEQELSPEEAEAIKLKRCSTAKAKWDDPEYREKTLAGIRKAAEERKAKRLAEKQAAGIEPPRKLTPEERREKLREAGRKAWQNPDFRERMRSQVVSLLQKRHKEMTDEEKQAWREAQRARARELWNDPEYRAKTLAAIQARHEQMRANGEVPAPRKKASRPASARPKVSSKKEQAAGVDRLRSLWQSRLALLAKTIKTMQMLEQRVTDLTKLERALANDPQRHAEAVNGINQATQCLAIASQKVKELSSSVPSFVKYDRFGNMVSFDGEAALKHHAEAQAAAAEAARTADTSPSSEPIGHLSPVLPTSTITPAQSAEGPSTSPTSDLTIENHLQQPTADNNMPSTSSPARSTSLPWNARPAANLANGTRNGVLNNGVAYPGVNGVHQGGSVLSNGVSSPLSNGVSGNLQNGIRNGTHDGVLQDGMGLGSMPNGLRNGTGGGPQPGSLLNGTQYGSTGHAVRDGTEIEDQPDSLL